MDERIRTNVLTAAICLAALTAGVLLFWLSSREQDLGPEYSYDIEQYARIDPALILYRQIGEALETGLQESRAITVGSDGTIYAVGDKKIVMMRDGGKREIELLEEPTCVEVDKDGTLIVGLNEYLTFFDAEGAVKQQWKAPAENALLTSIAVDSENIYAADAVNKVVWRFNREGVVINRIGARESKRNIPGIVIPSPYFDIAMYPDGLLRVVNPGRHLVEAYTPLGDREWYWGKPSVSVEGFSGCCNPVSLAVLPDGSFVTCEKGLVRVKVYNDSGEFVGVVAGPEELGWTGPMRVCESPEQCGQQSFDAAVDVAGRVYVLDTLRGTIRIFEKK